MFLKRIVDVDLRRVPIAFKGTEAILGIPQRNREVIDTVEGAGYLLAGRKRQGDLWGQFSRICRTAATSSRPGINPPSLQGQRIILFGDPGQILRCRVTRTATAGAVEIGFALLRIAGENIFEYVGRPMAGSVGANMQPGDNV